VIYTVRAPVVCRIRAHFCAEPANLCALGVLFCAESLFQGVGIVSDCADGVF